MEGSCAAQSRTAIEVTGRRQREPRATRLPAQAEGEPPLFLKANRRRNPRLRPSRRRHPFFGQIQRSADAPRADTGPQRRRDSHLAIGDLAQRATVLTGHATGAGPLFRKARPVENQHPRRSGTTARNRRQARSASQGACVMKCSTAWYATGPVTRASIACIDFRSLSLKTPRTYVRSDNNCARWPKQLLNCSSHRINRCTRAVAV